MLRLLQITDDVEEATALGKLKEFHIGRGFFIRTSPLGVDIRFFSFKTGKEKKPTRRGLFLNKEAFQKLVSHKDDIFQLWPALLYGTFCHIKPQFDCYQCNPGLAGRNIKERFDL